MVEDLPHFFTNVHKMFLCSFVLKQKNQKFKAVNRLSAGFSSTRHHLYGPSRLLAVIKDRAGIKCCHSVAENTLFPPTDSRPIEKQKIRFPLNEIHIYLF
jgi:hypothetical protein